MWLAKWLFTYVLKGFEGCMKIVGNGCGITNTISWYFECRFSLDRLL